MEVGNDGGEVKVTQEQELSPKVNDLHKSGVEYVAPATRVSTDTTLFIIFEQQTIHFLNDPAIIFEDKVISYKELNLRSNAVAHLISDRIGAHRKPDAVVALCLERSDLMVTAILGVWKAGIAYVPLDPKYPHERIKFILEDTQALLMLTDELNAPLAASYMDTGRILILGKAETEGRRAPPTSVGTQLHHLSQILYTSGTTGKPKGVMVTRAALVTECIDYRPRYGFKPGDREVIVHFLNYVFNAATVPLLVALSNGYPLLVVRPALLFQTEALYEYLGGHRVTHIDGTPSLLRRLDLTRIPSLKRVAIGGEPLTREAFNHFVTTAPGVAVFNIFGNTEGTMSVMTSRVEKEEDIKILRNVTTNKRCFIMSPTNDRVTAVGDVGELGVAGAGVARGYLNNQALTQDRFITNPFRTEEEKELGLIPVLFKTGDLFRVTLDGLESVGRSDHQVKIRGFRVELGEIETVIREFPNVSGAVVVATHLEKSDEAGLIGYYEMKSGDSAATTDEKVTEAILDHLRTILPDYMIPARLVRLEELPLTPNGKIDRNALPPPPPLASVSKSPVAGAVVGEQDPTTIERLSSIWAEILSLTEDEKSGLGVMYDFFEAGGNSLLALRLVERVNEELGTSVDAAHLFNYSSIQEFSDNLPVS